MAEADRAKSYYAAMDDDNRNHRGRLARDREHNIDRVTNDGSNDTNLDEVTKYGQWQWSWTVVMNSKVKMI